MQFIENEIFYIKMINIHNSSAKSLGNCSKFDLQKVSFKNFHFAQSNDHAKFDPLTKSLVR